MGLLPFRTSQNERADEERHGLTDYVQPPAGLVEKAIDLKPLRLQGAASSSYLALKDYEVRDFGKGLGALEQVMGHVLRNKLKHKKGSAAGIWPRTVCLSLQCTLTQRSTGTAFSTLQPKNVRDVDAALVEQEPHRVPDIEKYAEALRRGEQLGCPVYVTGAVLNAVMGRPKAEARDMYMLDGARRLTAAALTGQATVTVRLIVAETQVPDFIAEDRVAALRNKLHGLTWFDTYQSLPLVGLRGERTLARFDLMDIERLRDQVVMDFGCNVGGASLKAVQAGARRAVGVEGMPDTHALASEIGDAVGFENLSYLNVNFNDPHFDKQIDEAAPGKVDYAFFFSVYRTKELIQRERLFRYIIAKTQKGIFFEGHADPRIDTPEYHEWLFDCFDLRGEFLGFSEGNLRPLYFLNLRARG